MKRKATIARSSPRSPDYKWAHSSSSTSLLPPLPNYEWIEHNFAKDPRPLVAALESDQPLPEHLRLVLIDLFQRYRLKLKSGTKRIPSYLRMSRSEAELEIAAEEFGTRGPITRREMDAAVKVLEKRAKREGRGHISYDCMVAAKQLRDERFKRFAADHNKDPETLMNFIKGKRGSSRRRRVRP